MRARRTGEFWIACDFCDVWYDGKCVQVRRPLLFCNAWLAAALTVGSFSAFACAGLPARSWRLTLFTLAASASRGCPLFAFVAVPSSLQGCCIVTPGAAAARLQQQQRCLLRLLSLPD